MKRFSPGAIRHVLIVAPHPDDETIGAFGLIRLFRLRGVRVKVLVVADGAGSHRNSERWPRLRLVAERRRETRRAMRRIGVTAADTRFLGLPDGRVSDARGAAWRGLRQAIGAIRPPGLLVLPDATDDHADHRRTALTAVASHAPGVRRLSYLVWPAAGSPVVRATHGLALSATRSAKVSAIRGYRTQTGAITDDPAGFAISARQMQRFAPPIETYRTLRR